MRPSRWLIGAMSTMAVFAPFAAMVSEMPRYLPVAFASNQDVREGRLGDALRQVMALPFPEPAPANGARVAADRVAAALQAESRAASAARRGES